jgi:hypothetical protein
MISLRKYLDAASRKRLAESEPAPSSSLYQFAAALLDSIHNEFLAGEGFDSLRAEFTQLRDALRRDWTSEEEAEAVSTAQRILSDYRTSVRQSATQQAIEIQQIFATLNQALIVMAEGKDRTVSRLTTIQESVQKASLIDDIVALKSSLTATVDLIKKEAVQAQEAAVKEITQFSTELSKAREFIGNARTKMPGRPEGVTLITDCLDKRRDPAFLVAYLCDRLHAVSERYGPPVAEELLFRLINERVRPLTPDGAMFRWTSSSIVTAFSSFKDLPALRGEVTALNRTPLVHRISLGGRTAVLTISPSRFIAQGKPGEAADLIQQVDRFAQISS